MAKKALTVIIELDIQAVTCPGVWLCANGPVFLKIIMLSQHMKTKELTPVFPLLYHDGFKVGRCYPDIGSISNLVNQLSREKIFAKLMQRICEGDCVTLAIFKARLLDVLFPRPDGNSRVCGVDVDLLMEPTKRFPGILSPKIEVCTIIRVKESFCSGSVSMSLPKTLSSVKKPRSKRKKRGRQHAVCHTRLFHHYRHLLANRKEKEKAKKKNEKRGRRVCGVRIPPPPCPRQGGAEPPPPPPQQPYRVYECVNPKLPTQPIFNKPCASYSKTKLSNIEDLYDSPEVNRLLECIHRSKDERPYNNTSKNKNNKNNYHDEYFSYDFRPTDEQYNVTPSSRTKEKFRKRKSDPCFYPKISKKAEAHAEYDDICTCRSNESVVDDFTGLFEDMYRPAHQHLSYCHSEPTSKYSHHNIHELKRCGPDLYREKQVTFAADPGDGRPRDEFDPSDVHCDDCHQIHEQESQHVCEGGHAHSHDGGVPQSYVYPNQSPGYPQSEVAAQANARAADWICFTCRMANGIM